MALNHLALPSWLLRLCCTLLYSFENCRNSILNCSFLFLFQTPQQLIEFNKETKPTYVPHFYIKGTAMSSAVIRTLNFYVFFNSSNIRENSLIQATPIQNDSQHKYDTRLCGVSGILLLCLPVSSLFHFVPNIRVLTKQRPWRWTTNRRNRQVITSQSQWAWVSMSLLSVYFQS